MNRTDAQRELKRYLLGLFLLDDSHVDLDSLPLGSREFPAIETLISPFADFYPEEVYEDFCIYGVNFDVADLPFEVFLELGAHAMLYHDGFAYAVCPDHPKFDGSIPAPIASQVTVLDYFGRFCEGVGDWGEHFSDTERGLLLDLFGAYPLSFVDLLVNPAVPLSTRKDCLLRTRALFRTIRDREVAGQEPPVNPWMLWDWFCKSVADRGHGYQIPDNSDRAELQALILELLTEFVSYDSEVCQASALHGLGHLRHPGVRDVVQKYIEEHGHECDAQGLKWLEDCKKCDIM